MKRHSLDNQDHKRRGLPLGFTLIEILVTVSIIAMMVGLLLPALSSMRKNARIAHVKEDIDSLADAMELFKAEFGEYPPSRITLYATSAGWNGDPRSKAIIRKYWPKFNFTAPNGEADGAGGSFLSGPTHLDGAECLTFFLGGVRQFDTATMKAGAYIGFSKNPAQPFTRKGESRVGPFFPFPLDRLADADGDLLPEYLDPLPSQTTPYIYLSGYNGRGYQKFDLDADGDKMTTNDSRMDEIYTESGSTGWNAKSYQIISPGADGDYGDGGGFDPDTADSELIDLDLNMDGDTDDPGELREAERDNLTNFHGGPLGN